MYMMVKCPICHKEQIVFSLRFNSYLNKSVCRDCFHKNNVLYKKGKQSIILGDYSLQNGFFKITNKNKSTYIYIFEPYDSCVGMKDKTLKCLIWLIGA